MTVLNTLNFVTFNPLHNNNPIARRRRKLIAKIDKKSNLRLIKTTRLRNKSGSLMNMITKRRLK